MKQKFFFTLFICATLVTGFAFHGYAGVDWQILKTLKTDKTPIDMTISVSGKYIFVLSEGGVIHIYAAGGTMVDVINAGSHVDRIRASQNENLLYLQSTQNKTIDIVNLDFLQNINVEGSPFKGLKDAPVVVAVFSDFQ